MLILLFCTDLGRNIKNITHLEDPEQFKALIFRGNNQIFWDKNKQPASDRVQSSLYRLLKNNNVRHVENIIMHYQNNLINIAKKKFYNDKKFIDDSAILTPLRHFGGNVNLIDFTKDLNIALFFACHGDEHQEKDGEIFVCKRNDFSSDITDKLVDPQGDRISEGRVNIQHSIFIQPVLGYMDFTKSKPFLQSITIKSDVKKKILKYLDHYHDINAGTVYNDIFGFISDEDNIFTPRIYVDEGFRIMREGNTSSNDEKYDLASKKFSQVLSSDNKIWPDLFQNKLLAHLGIGIIYFYKNEHEIAKNKFREIYTLHDNNNNKKDNKDKEYFDPTFKELMKNFNDRIVSKNYGITAIEQFIKTEISKIK